MKELNDRELTNWDIVKREGFARYIMRWALYSVIFTVFILGILFISNGRSIGVSDVVIGLLVYVTLGISISIVRWRIINKKHQNLMKKQLKHIEKDIVSKS